jgi:hypothetical protein
MYTGTIGAKGWKGSGVDERATACQLAMARTIEATGARARARARAMGSNGRGRMETGNSDRGKSACHSTVFGVQRLSSPDGKPRGMTDRGEEKNEWSEQHD